MTISTIINWVVENLVPFTVLLGILVFVHELGHFLVARFCGVRVEVFSLGFGKKILQYKKGDTVYALSLIPLGGYVKMFGEQNGDVVSENERNVSFTHKTVWQRIAIVLAGPLMNFFFAILVFGFVAYVGEETRSARLAEIQQQSVAEAAGLKAQDKVLEVAGKSVRSYEELQKELNAHQNEKVDLKVQQDNEPVRTVNVQVSSIANPNIFASQKMIGQIDGVLPYTKGTLIAVKPESLAKRLGFQTGDEVTRINDKKVQSWNELSTLLKAANYSVTVERDSATEPGKKLPTTLQITLDASQVPQNLEAFGFEHPELYLEQIIPGSPAEKAEIQRYDKIVSINSQPMTSWEEVLKTIKSFDGKEALTVTLLRDGTEVMKKLTPQITSQMTAMGKEDRRYTIGIVPMANIAMPEVIKVKEESVFGALGKGWSRSWDISVMTVMSFVRLFQGEVSPKNVGGMISIGKAAKDSFAQGFQSFLMTMGILSISLFILNLLPIPVLDGGHLVFYGIEAVKGSPLSMKKIELAHQIGFALLMGLMVLAMFNDVTKFLFKT